MSQIYNLRNGIPRGAVRVDRRSPWGNQFVMRGTSEAERVRVCDAFEAWAMAPEQAAFRGWVRRDLAGKALACWCAPKRCHAETLRRIANEVTEPALPAREIETDSTVGRIDGPRLGSPINAGVHENTAEISARPAEVENGARPEPSAEIKCHDADCPQRLACPHFLADLSVERHVVSGRSGGGCDLWDLEAGLAGFGE